MAGGAGCIFAVSVHCLLTLGHIQIIEGVFYWEKYPTFMLLWSPPLPKLKLLFQYKGQIT